jgi:hypothetical protein
MIQAVASTHVDAPAQRVLALYADPANWATLFPETIRAARIVRREAGTMVVEVDHVEGKVMNVLRPVSPTRLELTEWKRRYEATFLNEFQPEARGTRCTVIAQVRLRWPYRVLAPLLKPIVLARVRRYVLEPLKVAAEGGFARQSGVDG